MTAKMPLVERLVAVAASFLNSTVIVGNPIVSVLSYGKFFHELLCHVYFRPYLENIHIK